MLKQVQLVVRLDHLADIQSVLYTPFTLLIQEHHFLIALLHGSSEACEHLVHDSLVARIDELFVLDDVLLKQNFAHVFLRQLV